MTLYGALIRRHHMMAAACDVLLGGFKDFLLNFYLFFGGLGFRDWSHWIRVEILCKTAVSARRELSRRPRLWPKMFPR